MVVNDTSVVACVRRMPEYKAMDVLNEITGSDLSGVRLSACIATEQDNAASSLCSLPTVAVVCALGGCKSAPAVQRCILAECLATHVQTYILLDAGPEHSCLLDGHLQAAQGTAGLKQVNTY
jgi:hypothetical protein